MTPKEKAELQAKAADYAIALRDDQGAFACPWGSGDDDGDGCGDCPACHLNETLALLSPIDEEN